MVARILHIDTESGWRGGQNQLRLLIEGMTGHPDFACHAAVRANSRAHERLKTLCPTLALPAKGGIANAWRLKKYCEEHRIDILDAHSSKAHGLALLTKLLLPRLKVVVHRRVDYRPSPGLSTRLKYRTKKVDLYVAISSAIGRILEEAGVPRAKIRVVHSATPDTPFVGLDRARCKRELAQALGLDDDMPFVGNASALTSQKGYETLIHAMRHLKDRGRRVHCIIAGEGVLRGELERLRLELDLDHDVTFLGFVKDVPKVLGALDVLAVTSNFEGLGTILLDGTHAGCCLVASDVGGIPEVVVHEKTGLLVPVGDPDAVANALARVLDDAELRRRLVEGAKARVESAFSVKAMVEGNLAVYREVLS